MIIKEGYSTYEASKIRQIFSLLSDLAAPAQLTRSRLVALLEECRTEEAAHILDHLEDAWATLDLLKEKFGMQRAIDLILCEVRRERYSIYLDEGGPP